MDITHEQLKSLIHYDPLTGIVTWKIKPSKKIKEGSRAGTVCVSRSKHYRSITIEGYRKREHCWIWFYMTGKYPECEIDHRDGNGLNNVWGNLRHVTTSENRHNHRKYSNNKSGITGVFWDSNKKSWVVRFNIDGKQKQIAQRKDFFEACCIRKSLENFHGYSKQHGSERPY